MASTLLPRSYFNLLRTTSRFFQPSYSASTTSTEKVDDLLKRAEAPLEPSTTATEATLVEPSTDPHFSSGVTIVVEEPACVAPVTGIPEEHVKTRLVRIYKPAKNSMQSGTENTHAWTLDFDNRERWENPLMGWASSADPLSNLKIYYKSADDAIRHCEKNGWQYYVEPEKPVAPKVKNYGFNFSWNKRYRVSTK